MLALGLGLRQLGLASCECSGWLCVQLLAGAGPAPAVRTSGSGLEPSQQIWKEGPRSRLPWFSDFLFLACSSSTSLSAGVDRSLVSTSRQLWCQSTPVTRFLHRLALPPVSVQIGDDPFPFRLTPYFFFFVSAWSECLHVLSIPLSPPAGKSKAEGKPCRESKRTFVSLVDFSNLWS